MKYKQILLTFIVFFSFIFLSFGTSISHSGWIMTNTTWNVDTVKVLSDVRIVNGVKLTITPGTRIEFHGMFKIEILGALEAIGNAQDSITFTSPDTTNFYGTTLDDGGWDGLYFNIITNTNDSSILSHCIVEFTKWKSSNGQPSAIRIDLTDRIRISNSKIRHNYYKVGVSAGIYLIGSSPIIIDNYFTKNSGDQGACIALSNGSAPLIHHNIFYDNFASRSGGAIMSQSSFPIITNNYICNNSTLANNCGPADGGGGIRCTNGTIAYIANNVIANNNTGMKGGGIECLYGSNSIIENNTIVNNNGYFGGGGIYLFQSSPEITNNIIWGNTRFNNVISNQFFLFTDDSEPTILNSCIEGDSTDFMHGANCSYSGTYLNNINVDPLFVSPSLGAGTNFDGLTANWQLQAGSPCINTGTNSVNISMPAIDLAGTPRISGTIDMGAYETLSTNVITNNNENEFSLYPNPANSIININSEKIGENITILDYSGKIIIEIKSMGKLTSINIESLKRGIYLIQIKSNDLVKSKRFIKL